MDYPDLTGPSALQFFAVQDALSMREANRISQAVAPIIRLTVYTMLGMVRFVSYAIAYYCEAVKTEVDAWPAGLRARYRALSLRMAEHGPNLGMPHSRAMGDGLFELRAKSSEGIGRAFYCALAGRRIIILHAFVKKSDKTPPKELKLARNRMKEVLHHG